MLLGGVEEVGGGWRGGVDIRGGTTGGGSAALGGGGAAPTGTLAGGSEEGGGRGANTCTCGCTCGCTCPCACTCGGCTGADKDARLVISNRRCSRGEAFSLPSKAATTTRFTPRRRGGGGWMSEDEEGEGGDEGMRGCVGETGGGGIRVRVEEGNESTLRRGVRYVP